MLDELERVRAFGTDIPEPDIDTILAARAELMAAIREQPGAQQRRRRRQRRYRLALAGALTSVGLAIAAAFGLSTPASPPSALAATINRLAHIAASQGQPGIPGTGQYLYTASVSFNPAQSIGHGRSCVVSQAQRRRLWVATDGSGAISDMRSQSRFTSSADRSRCAAIGIGRADAQNSTQARTFPAGGLSFPATNWSSLSTDPATLLHQLQLRYGGPNTPERRFENIGKLLSEPEVPPTLRATAYRAVLLIPDVVLTGSKTLQPVGPDVNIGFYANAPGGSHWLRELLVFDRTTARLLGKATMSNGQWTNWTDYQPARIVDGHPAYPLNK